MKRHLFFLLPIFFLISCGQQDATEEPVVYVYNWSDYIAKESIKQFEESTGVKVVYDEYDSNEIVEAKLLTGSTGYDLIFPSARPFAQRHIAAVRYAALDKSKLPALPNIDPAILYGLGDVDPGNQHVVPYLWGTTGLGINIKKVREVLGENAALDSWSLLFDPSVSSKLADCGISVLDDKQEGFGAALIYRQRDPNGYSADEDEVVYQTFTAISANIRTFNSSEYIDDLANGNLCLALGFSGDIFQARDRAVEAGNGVEIEYVIPKEGAVRWIDVMAIPKDAAHPGNAHRLINHLLQPEVAAAISNYVGYATPNLGAMALLDAGISGNPGIYPPKEVMAKLVDLVLLPDEVQRERARVWKAIKSGDQQWHSRSAAANQSNKQTEEQKAPSQ
ncbi:MAG TPA: polyamine ABC transporter substrate-binding protein [Gammaproteobacteria bacterium]|nr:polyamine ABC transporter substrate-binding protein [Gammaproteobacteria bacterium]